MLILQIKRAPVSEEKLAGFESFLSAVPKTFRPLIEPTRNAQAEILGHALEFLRSPEDSPSVLYGVRPRIARKAEIFTDGTSLLVTGIFLERLEERENKPDSDLHFYLYYIGPDRTPQVLCTLEDAFTAAFGTALETYYYSSSRFKELLKEGRAAPSPPSKAQLKGSQILRDRAARMLAIAIKSSGGLLVRDLAKQLPQDMRDRTDAAQEALLKGGLIDAEIVVVCSKTQAQTARVPKRELLEQLSDQGLKCACGRPIIKERTEEALTITEEGRDLLDGSRWMTFLLLGGCPRIRLFLP